MAKTTIWKLIILCDYQLLLALVFFVQVLVLFDGFPHVEVQTVHFLHDKIHFDGYIFARHEVEVLAVDIQAKGARVDILDKPKVSFVGQIEAVRLAVAST